jgi:hypothetical protein
VPYGYVKENGTLLMSLKDGEVSFPKIANQNTPAGTAAEQEESQPPEE